MKALYLMSLLCKRLPAAYLIKNFLPSLKYIAENFKSPAVAMCILGCYEALADIVGVDSIATSILPVLTPMLTDRSLTKQQFELVSKRVETMFGKVIYNYVHHKYRMSLENVFNLMT